MRAAPSRTMRWLLLVLAGIGPVVLLGCSSAGRMLVSRDLQTAPSADQRTDRGPLDLMPAPSATKPGGRPAVGQIADATGPLRPSPDGTWVAFESERDGVHGVWVARPSGERVHRVSGTRFALMPRWSPDSTRLIFLARDARRPDTWNLWIADPEETTGRKLASAGAVSLAGAAWFPDSRHVCYGSHNWLTVVDTEANTTRAFKLPEESSVIIGVPAVSPDGRRVAFAVEGDGAWMVSLDSGDVRQIVTESEVDAFAWAPGGRQIAFRDARDGQWKVQMLK